MEEKKTVKDIEELNRLSDDDFKGLLLSGVAYGMQPNELEEIKSLANNRAFLLLQKLMKRKMEDAGREVIKDTLTSIRKGVSVNGISKQAIFVAGKYEGLNIVFKQPKWASGELDKLKARKNGKAKKI